MHAHLFAANATLTHSDLLDHAASLHLRPEDFQSCLETTVMLERVMEDRRAISSQGLDDEGVRP